MKTKISSITIGLDLGDKKHALCVLNQEGDIIDERSINNRREFKTVMTIQLNPQSKPRPQVGVRGLRHSYGCLFVRG